MGKIAYWARRLGASWGPVAGLGLLAALCSAHEGFAQTPLSKLGSPVDIRAISPMGINACTNGRNVAPDIDLAVALGYHSALLPAHCLYQPDGGEPGGTLNQTPADFGIVGEDNESSLIQSNNVATNDVNLGPRSWVERVLTQGYFCTHGAGGSGAPANLNRICPLLGLATNAQDIATALAVYPGDSFDSFNGIVTYAGITTTAGNSGRGFVAVHNSADAFFAGCGTSLSDCLRTSSGGDVASIVSMQFSTDSFPVRWQCNKFRGTGGNQLAVASNDIECEIQSQGYDGANLVANGYIFWQAVGSVSSGIVPSQFVLDVMNGSGSILSALVISGVNGTIATNGHTIATTAGVLSSSNGVNCSGSPTASFATSNGIVTHC